MAREYTNIADAISAVNTEVSAQTTQIADILTALEGKSGGGLPYPITEYSFGAFELDENVTSIEIPHGLSGAPWILVWDDGWNSNILQNGSTFHIVSPTIKVGSTSANKRVVMYRYKHATSGNLLVTSNTAWADIQGGTKLNNVGTMYAQNANGEQIHYKWIAIGLSEVTK